MEQENHRRANRKDAKEREKVKGILRNLKKVLVTNNNLESLYQYLCELCQSSPNHEQIKLFDKMIKGVCIRLQSALKMVDLFVYVIMCLSSSTHCASEIFTEEDFEQCLNNILELTKRTEINDWIRNIKQFIQQAKRNKSMVSQVKQKKPEDKVKDKYPDEIKMKQQHKSVQISVPRIESNTKTQINFSIEAKTGQKKEQSMIIIQPFRKKCNDQFSQSNCQLIQEKAPLQNKQPSQRQLNKCQIEPIKRHAVIEPNEQPISVNSYTSATKSTNNSNGQYSYKQTSQKLQSSKTCHQKQDQMQNNELQQVQTAMVDKNKEESDRLLMKKIFAIRNPTNLFFLKKLLWDECNFQIKNAEEIHSSDESQDLDLDPSALENKNVLLMLQLTNGILIGAFKRQGKHINNQISNGFLFSLNKKQAFPALLESDEQQLIKLDQKKLIIGNGELTINNQQMTVTSTFGSGKGVFDCKNRDLDFLIGEGSQKKAQLMKYAIYQIM